LQARERFAEILDQVEQRQSIGIISADTAFDEYGVKRVW
jgi:hypothetical protein